MSKDLALKLHEVEQYIQHLIGENATLKQEQQYLQNKLVALTQERAKLKENQLKASQYVKNIMKNLKEELG